MKFIWEEDDVFGRLVHISGKDHSQAMIGYNEKDRTSADRASKRDPRWQLMDMSDGMVLVSQKTRYELAQWLNANRYAPCTLSTNPGL